MKLLVLDANSIVNRAFYGIKLLSTKNGQYTNAIVGFMNILYKLEQEETPDEIAIAFDLPEPTFRHQMYGGYKAGRKGMPQELAGQIPLLKELLAHLGYVQLSCRGYEADDILGSLAAAAQARGTQCLLATGDRDSLQLVAPCVTVLLTTTQMGRGVTTRINEVAIKEKYGLSPGQLIDVKALMGDASDNIPGVPGVGEKTALALIQQFGSLQAVYKNLEDASIKPGLRQKLESGLESAQLSLRLAKIDCNVPIATQEGAYKKAAANTQAAAALLLALEMHSTAKRLGLAALSGGGLAGSAAPPFGKQPGTQAAGDKTPVQQNLQDMAAAAGAAASTAQGGQVQAQPLVGLPAGVFYVAPASGGFVVVPQGKAQVFFAAEGSPYLLKFLQDAEAQKHVYHAKELHRLVLADGGQKNRAQSIVFDARLAAYLLNPAATGYQLEQLAGEYGAQPAFTCTQYPVAALLQSLYTALAAACTAAGMLALLQDIELPLAEVLASMELYGFALNAQGLQAFGQELQEQLNTQLTAIYSQVGYQFNLNSPKQLGEALFVKLGLPTRKKTKSGFSTDAETLQSLRKYSPVIDDILLYRTYQKLNSTYVEGLLKAVGEDGRIHSTFNQTEARTGRISSNEPNMQNIPIRTQLGSRLRQFFVAPPGQLLADADYSQIELRILAHISGDEAMCQAFKNGEDIHRATAALVNGLPQKMVTPALRAAAKAVNFGIVYGIGAFSLAKDLGISVKEAEDFINSYLNSFPGVRRYMESSIAFGKKHGYVQTLYGRRRHLPELASSNKNIQALGQRMALNTPIQGSAADIIKLAMIRVWQRLRSENLQAKLILQVHDELIVQAPQGEAAQVCSILHQEMEQAAALCVPMQADVHTGQDWLSAKG